MNEQILKRLQDTMKLYSVVLEQLEQLQWTVKEILEDIELEISPGQVVPGAEGAKDVKESALNT